MYTFSKIQPDRRPPPHVRAPYQYIYIDNSEYIAKQRDTWAANRKIVCVCALVELESVCENFDAALCVCVCLLLMPLMCSALCTQAVFKRPFQIMYPYSIHYHHNSVYYIYIRVYFISYYDVFTCRLLFYMFESHGQTTTSACTIRVRV